MGLKSSYIKNNKTPFQHRIDLLCRMIATLLLTATNYAYAAHPSPNDILDKAVNLSGQPTDTEVCELTESGIIILNSETTCKKNENKNLIKDENKKKIKLNQNNLFEQLNRIKVTTEVIAIPSLLELLNQFIPRKKL